LAAVEHKEEGERLKDKGQSIKVKGQRIKVGRRFSPPGG
jgi:hypothetical protein